MADARTGTWQAVGREANLCCRPWASDAITTYLGRQKGWKTLRERLSARGERAVPYSFRHSYSLRGHQLGIDAGSVALSMGHSYEVHCRSYPWASESGAATVFARALAGQKKRLSMTVDG